MERLPPLEHIAAVTGRLRDPQVPWCETCGTDEFLIYEDFLPQAVLPGGGRQSASVGFTCSRCEQFDAQNVPPSWSPPGWFWYA